jgi:hypothetical protein
MDPAFLTALSALVIALLGAGSQLWQIRAQQDLARKQARDTKSLELSWETFKAHSVALRETCTAVQGFLDELMLLQKAAPGTILGVDQRKRILAARDAVLQSYKEHHPVLDASERRILFEVRDRCANVVLMLDLGKVWSPEYLNLDEAQRASVHQASTQLANLHQRLLLGGLQRLQVEFETQTLAR